MISKLKSGKELTCPKLLRHSCSIGIVLVGRGSRQAVVKLYAKLDVSTVEVLNDSYSMP